jgi:CBS domain-containing protein
MKVQEFIQRSAVTVGPGCTIEQAARTMADKGVGSLMVVDGGRLTGVLTDRDLVVKVLAGKKPTDGRVDSVMSMNVVAVDADADIRDAIRAFSSHAVRRLPVVRGSEVVGVLSLDEVLVTLTAELSESVQGVTAQLMFPHATDPQPLPIR